MSDKPKIVQWNSATGESVDVPVGKEYKPDIDEGPPSDTAMGVVIPRGSKSSVKYLENARDYNQTDAGVHKQIHLSNQMYLWEGIVGTTIDLFVDFAITDFTLEGIPEKTREAALCDHFLKYVNKNNNNMDTGMKALLREMMEDYFIAGNIFPFRSMESVSGSEINDERIRGSKGWKLPMNIYLLNPMFIEIPEAKVLIGNKEVWLKIDEEIVRKVQEEPDSPEAQDILSGLTPAMRRQLKENGKVKLSDDVFNHIKRKSKGYMGWGRPYLTRAFSAFARKKKIEALDESTIDGLINRVTIFKIGLQKDETWKTWSVERQNAFASHLKNPNPSNWLVWGPDVEVEEVGPSDTILSFENRYDQADRDILKALGIPTVMISGEGNSDKTENVWVAIAGLLEKLQAARDQLQIWLEEVLLDILEENQLPTKNRPKIRFTRMNLRNEKELRDFVIALFDRGILPIETVVKEAKYDWEIIKEQRVAELIEKIKGKSFEDVFQRRDLPFSGTGGAPKGGAPFTQKPGGGNSPKKGRPPGGVLRKPSSTKTKTTMRDNPPKLRQPKAQASEIPPDEGALYDLVSETVEKAVKSIKPDTEKFDGLAEAIVEFSRLSQIFSDVSDAEASEAIEKEIDSVKLDFTVGMKAVRAISEESGRDIVFEALIANTERRLLNLANEVLKGE